MAELTPPVHAVGASLVSCPLSVLSISPGCLLRCSLPGARELFCPLDRTQASQHLHLSFRRGSLRKLSHSWSSSGCFVLVSLSRLCSLKPTLALVIFILFLSFFFFLGQHQHHMEVPRLGVESELQLPPLHQSHGNATSKPHL